MIREAAKSAVRAEIESIKRERVVRISEKLEPGELELELEPREMPERLRKRRPALVEDEDTLKAIRYRSFVEP